MTSIVAGGGARRIIVAGAVLIAVTIAGAGLSLWDLRRDAIDAACGEMANLGIVLAGELARSMESVDLVLGETTQRLVHSSAATPDEFRRDMASEVTHDFLVNRLRALPQLGALFLTDAAGIQINSSNFWPVPAIDLANVPSFADAQKTPAETLVIGAPAKSWSTGRWALFFSRRIESRAGVFLGTVQAMIELHYLDGFYRTIGLSDDGSVAIFRRDGTLLFRHPALDNMLGTTPGPGSQWFDLAARGGGTYEAPGYLDGVRREIAVSPVKDYPFVVTVTVPKYAALAAWRRQAAFIGIGTGCAVLVFALLFTTLAVQFSRLEGSRQALAIALTTTERADRAKSDFLGRMSHELRTPLNAIIGFSEVMTHGVFGPLGSPRYLEYAEDIHRSGVFLHDLISDMLDMVKIEAGHRALQLEPFALATELEETLRMIRPRAKKGEVAVGLDVRDPSMVLTADRRAFKQIVAEPDRQCGEVHAARRQRDGPPVVHRGGRRAASHRHRLRHVAGTPREARHPVLPRRGQPARGKHRGHRARGGPDQITDRAAWLGDRIRQRTRPRHDRDDHDACRCRGGARGSPARAGGRVEQRPGRKSCYLVMPGLVPASSRRFNRPNVVVGRWMAGSSPAMTK